MITTLKSTKEVGIDISNPSTKAVIYCEISNYIQTSDNYGANGLYYYLVETPSEPEPTFTKVPLKGFTVYFTIDEINTLYSTIEPHYPTGATYNECRVIDIVDGLKYELTENPQFGLSGNEWEVVEQSSE